MEELVSVDAGHADKYACGVINVQPTSADYRHTVGGGVERVVPARTGQVLRGEEHDPAR